MLASERAFSISACWPPAGSRLQARSGAHDLPRRRLSSDGCCARRASRSPASIANAIATIWHSRSRRVCVCLSRSHSASRAREISDTSPEPRPGKIAGARCVPSQAQFRLRKSQPPLQLRWPAAVPANRQFQGGHQLNVPLISLSSETNDLLCLRSNVFAALHSPP